MNPSSQEDFNIVHPHRHSDITKSMADLQLEVKVLQIDLSRALTKIDFLMKAIGHR